MYKKVEPWADVIDIEHRIQAFWDETKAFDKMREIHRNDPPWSFLDGPITANNPMGVHHAWGRTLKDVYQRYFTMTGHKLRYQNGFDCQGLWVEVEVEKALNFKTKRDIESFGIGNFVEKCKERVRKYSAIQTAQSIRLGYWMDWENSYFTMSDENNYTIWNFLKKCHHRGLIYRGLDVMPWCPRCGVGLSQMEMHEGYKTTAHRAVFVRFPLRDREREYLLVWTTTPWTLTSNVGASVNPGLKYIKVKCGGDIYYLAEGALHFKRKEQDFKDGASSGRWIDGVPPLKTPAQLFEERGGFEILEVMKGSGLVGWTYDGPFDELPALAAQGGYPDESDLHPGLTGRECHKVIPWDEVSETEGTGIVHTAPGCGKEDYDLGREHGLVPIAPLDESGHYVAGFGWLEGLGVNEKETTKALIRDLDKKGLLVAVEQYPHTYPHCWRCSSELLFRMVDEWFISMDPWKEEIMELVKQIRWIPAYGREQELDWLKNMRDWMISKKRYWGLALPIWVCDDGDCKHFEVLGSRAELEEQATAGLDALEGHSPHRPWIDAVKITCPKCGGRASRVSDVGNPWLDAGIVPYSTMGYNDDREEWRKWFPADLVLECFPGQFRNWFYALLAMSTMMENERPFKTLLGHALVRDEKGNEMHKSQGNAIWFDDAVEKIGADVMRWIYCMSEPTIHLNFGYGIAREQRGRFINTFWNIYAFFVNYARIDQFSPPSTPTPVSERPELDRWALSNLQLLIKKAHQEYQNFNIRGFSRAAAQYVEELSNWYIRRSRRRFWRGKDSQDSAMAYETLYESLLSLLRMLAPVMPFLAEEIYQNLVRTQDREAPESVHHLSFPEVREELIDEALSSEMKAVIDIISLGLAARNNAGLRTRQPLSELIVKPTDGALKRALEKFESTILEELNIKALTVMNPDEALPCTLSAKANFAALGPRYGKGTGLVAKAIAALDSEALATRPIVVEVNGEALTLDEGDVEIIKELPEGLSIAEDGDTQAAVVTTLTEELTREGMMRDLLRKIQILRKESGLEMEDRIRLRYHTTSAELERAIAEHEDFIYSELLCTDGAKGEPGEGWQQLQVRECLIDMHIEKV